MPNRTHLPGPSALPEYKACLSVWSPYSVDPEAELRFIVWGQLTCWEGREQIPPSKIGGRGERVAGIVFTCSIVMLNHPEILLPVSKFVAMYAYFFFFFFCICIM